MRRTVAIALVVLASLLLFGAVVAGYARRAAFDSDHFANRATAALQDTSVRTVIGERVTDQLVLRNEEDLLAARPIIATVVADVVGSPPFRALFRSAVLDVHRAVFARDEDTVTLTLADVGTVAAAALQQVRPQLAADLERSGNVVVVSESIGTATADAARIADEVRILVYVLVALTLAAAIAALVVTPDRRATIAQLGVSAAVVGVLIVIGLTIARAILLSRVDDPDTRDAAGAVWNEFLGDLRTFGWLLAGAGAVVAAAAASLIRPLAVERPLRRIWGAATTEPARPWPRVGRALALVALGVLVVAAPLTALQVVATLVGVFLLYTGLESILRLVYRPSASQEEAQVVRRMPRIVVPLVAGVLIAAGIAAFVAAGGTTEPAAATTTCNGSEALCDRPFDEVVLPATHNSMSVPLRGWFSAEQDRPIDGQLEDGIRGLLLDTHYADRLPNGNVRTYFGSTAKLNLAVKQGDLSQESVDAALRLRDRLGFRGEGERGMYLCHTFCELGATPVADGLSDIRTFLVTHPSDVVVVVNQDYLTPADFVGAVDDAGLAKYAFTPPAAGARWPTLRKMIDSDRRLILLAENEAGAAPWYQLAYQRLVEETPFNYPRAGLLTDPAKVDASCEPNRGPERAPLFLINHWVSTDPVPRPSDAAKVNAYEPLLRRARACERIRDHLPNLLAVNFYKRGDVFRVVDTLNGIE